MLATRAREQQQLRALATLLRKNPELRDAYTALLAGIRLSVPFGSGKSILVTSTQPNEGKTTVASCLAIVASLSGRTVLLIDGDLRRPSLAMAAGVPDGIGFGEVLEGNAESADAINPVELFEASRDASALSIMSAGGKPPEVLVNVDRARAKAAVQSISQRFDLIIFDSPPVLAANDALLLAGIVDGVLLVVGTGSADLEEVRRAKEQLEPIGTPLIGVVLNRFDPKIHGRAERPYSGYYLGGKQ